MPEASLHEHLVAVITVLIDGDDGSSTCCAAKTKAAVDGATALLDRRGSARDAKWLRRFHDDLQAAEKDKFYRALLGEEPTTVPQKWRLYLCQYAVDILEADKHELVSYKDICTVLGVDLKTLRNQVSKWRKQSPPINDPYPYSVIRPFTLKTWPKKAGLFPESFPAFQRILSERRATKRAR